MQTDREPATGPGLDLKTSADSAASHGASELERLAYLDGWRGIAILLVLEAHFLGWLPVDSGRLGVNVFFCLSGILMGRILFIRRVPLGTFYKRRFSRIYPAFAAYVLTIFLVAFFLGISFTALDVTSTLFFLRTYVGLPPTIWGHPVPINHIWSLNVEEHSYMLLSVLTLVTVLRGREGLALLLLGTGCIATHLAYIKFPAISPPWEMGLGTETAASTLLISSGYCLLRQRAQIAVPPWAPIAALGLATLCHTDALPWWSQVILSPFLLAFAVNHLSDAARWFLSLLANPLLRLVGIWSFSIYLWQQPFYFMKSHLWGGSATAFAVAVTIGVCSFYFLENPARTWLNKNW